MKNLLYMLLLFPALVLAQSQDQNYIKTLTYKEETTSTDATKANATITYFDGLGRPVQQIAGKASGSGNDIITHIEYDGFGRQVKEYLPYSSGTATLAFDASALTNTLNFYNTADYQNTTNPYSEKFLEASPLNRVLKQGEPGTDWMGNVANNNDHTIKTAYLINRDNEVKKLTAIAAWNSTDGVYGITFVSGGTYAAKQLYKTITQDENKTSSINITTTATIAQKVNTTEEFKDKEGKVVLKRTYNQFPGLSKNGTPETKYETLDTYYVYDQFGNLTYVLPPLAEGAVTYADELCYQYKYDYRNRLVEKKIPGKHWEYIVYDALDRPVATGPASTPFGGTATGWLITKYDAFSRVAYTGWYASSVFTSAGRKAMQSQPFAVVTKTSTPTTIDNIPVSYTNSYPTDMKVLTVNYYDNYTFPGAPAFPITIEAQPTLINVKGLATGSWVRVLTGSSLTDNETAYTLYDAKGRQIRNKTTNYLTGYTQIDSKLDFDGTTLYTITTHKRQGTDTNILTVRDDYTYTAQDRLLTHTHKINNAPVSQILATNAYTELGLLKSKTMGGTGAPGTILQKQDFKYNIRGWLTDINDITALTGELGIPGDLFAYRISYNNASGITSPLYNGNIAETSWRSLSDNVLRKYSYNYDNLNRLRDAHYQKPESSIPFAQSYSEFANYDKNGNITFLTRNGGLDDATAPIEIDNLTYSYNTNSNKLVNVTDGSASPQGFKDVDQAGTDDYTYYDNGNVKTDLNKGITTPILYNHLNLPTEISFGGNNKIKYLYNAAGVKVKKTVTEDTSGTLITMVVDYLSGFQYKGTVLQFVPTSEGYVQPTLVAGVYVYSYIYQYKDHLGNVRMNFATKPNGIVAIKEETHYYPFGLKHDNYNMDYLEFQDIEGQLELYPPITAGGELPYNYKYNGKELQDELGLNIYDYGARNYDPALGRWFNIDPKAETSRKWSPYTYAYNNPIYFVDPDGMQGEDWYKNLFTGNVSWKDGHSSRLGYENLGHTWGSTDVNGNRFLMDGDTKQISYNGKVLQDFNKNKSAFDITNGFTLWGGSPGGGGDTSGLKGITKDSFTASDVPGIGGTAPGPGQMSALGKIATLIKNFLNGASATGVTAGVAGRVDTIKTTVNSTEEANKQEEKQVEYVRTAHDEKTGNSTYVRKDIYDARQKKKNEQE